jgi:imidazolonepropionase-like amidohydrolase
MRSLYAGRLERFGQALDAGVPIYAGTDAGGYQPHGLVGAEMAALTRFCSAEYALGAGSWRARRWLGRPDSLSEGAPADLVVFDHDPRTDIGVLRAPSAIVLRGARVG